MTLIHGKKYNSGVTKTAILPVFNEENSVVRVVDDLTRYVDSIIVVNDGSTDNTDQLLKIWVKTKPVNVKFYYIKSEKNYGMSASLKKGFYLVQRLIEERTITENDIIINLDADGQHLPNYIPKVTDYLIKNDYDVVLTRRDLKQHNLYKRFGNWGLTIIARILSGFKYEDIECGYRFLKARIVTELVKYYIGRRYSCAQEIGVITAILGYRIDNNYMVDIPFYRKRGTRTRDGFIILCYAILVFIKLKLRKIIRYKNYSTNFMDRTMRELRVFE